MYYSNQTLRHKITNKLAALCPTEKDTVWKWDATNNTLFISEEGIKFLDDIKNYTHIEDELGRPYCKQPEEGQFVDISAKKYLLSSSRLYALRRKKCLAWELDLLLQMENKRSISSPFADGSISIVFKNFFLRRRGAKPFYQEFDEYYNKFKDSNGYVFTYNNKTWLYNPTFSKLVVIKKLSIGG